jgi:GNAT superfamily N-acetyltransferase
VIVRRAIPGDISQMCDLLSELFSIEADFTPDREKQARGLNLLINDTSGSSVVFVAVDAGDVVGMCSVQLLISTAEGGAVGVVEDVVVRRGYRGKGTGTRLLSEIIRWCGKKKIARLQLLRDSDNAEAHKFYTGNGWADTKLLCMRRYL